jgi:ADP-heptose:LPS heptosyltransferase
LSGNPDSILVYVGLDAVGDGLIKLPFVRALRAAFPQSHISWMAGKGHSVFAGSLAPLVKGLIDEVLDEAGIGSRWTELLARPMTRRFDLIIDTQRRLLTSLILRRIPHGRFISAAAGFALSDAKPKAYQRPAAMVAQLLDLVALASGSPCPAPAPLILDAETLARAEHLLPHGPTYVGLAPGAGGKHKCWPLDRFAQLARDIAERGAVPVVLLGPAEADWAKAMAVPGALFPLQAADGPITPMLTIALAARMACAVANDSGTGHMLAAAPIPLVSLFGPTPPEKFAPASPRLRLIRAQDFGTDSMDAIPLDAVATAVFDLL